MTASWSQIEATALDELAGACPQFAKHRSGSCGQFVVAIVALSKTNLCRAAQDNRLEVALSGCPAPPAASTAAQTFNKIADAMNHGMLRSPGQFRFDFATLLNDQGYPQLMVEMLVDGAAASELTTLTEILGAAAGAVLKLASQHFGEHVAAMLTRDAPFVAGLRPGLSDTLQWLLAPEYSGDARRPVVLTRRGQAFSLYGSLVRTLREAEITATIDRGEPLAPVLAHRLSLTEAELRAFRGARSAAESVVQWDDFGNAARRLKAYPAPQHEWPGGGLPDRAFAWVNSPWLGSHQTHLIRPDYFIEGEPQVQDALLALKDDLLRPLVADRMGAGPRGSSVQIFAGALRFPDKLHTSGDYRAFLGGLHRAIVGPRKAKAFQQAVVLWHRRAASLSALRHERSAKRPGWPPLCAPWRSVDKSYEMVALTSAADLVVEGNEMRHCVGGYYDVCRRGDTQILSLRRDGQRVATAELMLEGDIDDPSLRVGQFKAVDNGRPKPDLHDALRVFLRDVRSGAHPINLVRLGRYRRRMRKAGDYVWRADALPIAHAREAYSLYRPLLPRNAPATFDDWSVESGLVDTIDRAIAALADGSSR